jgi:hypothetical protein
VLITSWKLQHYFQKYSISIVTDYPLGDILWNQDATGRISKWAVELGALNIDLKLRIAIKSQALVDFMAEWWENQQPTPTEPPEHWVMYFDGFLKLEGVSAGVLLISPTGEECRCLNLSTSIGGTRSKVEGEDRHDLEPEGTREDTRHEIYTGLGSRSSYPTSCLE